MGYQRRGVDNKDAKENIVMLWLEEEKHGGEQPHKDKKAV